MDIHVQYTTCGCIPVSVDTVWVHLVVSVDTGVDTCVDTCVDTTVDSVWL